MSVRMLYAFFSAGLHACILLHQTQFMTPKACGQGRTIYICSLIIFNLPPPPTPQKMSAGPGSSVKIFYWSARIFMDKISSV